MGRKLALLFVNSYTDVIVTRGSDDQGVDILATKRGKKYAIQIKRYSKPVGNAAVQAVYAGAKYYGGACPIVLTNNYFTRQAVVLAKRTGVELWDRERLFSLINSAGYVVVE